MKIKIWSGLLNYISGSLLVILIALLSGGGLGIYNGNGWYIIPFILGIFMCRGFKQPVYARPQKVWLLTVFGQMTTIEVTGLTLVLDWIPGFKIISYVEFELKNVEKNINLAKRIKCADGKYIDGFFSVSLVADAEDDPIGFRDCYNEWKSGGQKLRDFGNYEDEKGEGLKTILELLDDILTTYMQIYANLYSSTWLEQHVQEITDPMLESIKGNVAPPGGIPNNQLRNARGLGIKFRKFQIILKPSDKVMDATDDIRVQEEKRRAEVVDTETVNAQIAIRLKIYKDGVPDPANPDRMLTLPVPPDKIPSIDQIRAAILQENLVHDGKLQQVINQGGLTMVDVQQNQRPTP